MDFKQGERDASIQSGAPELGGWFEDSDADDLYAEDVTAQLLSIAGVLGLLVLMAVAASLGFATQLFRNS